MNRLASEKSPYLRQHATNPVDWYPWGAEAFERARREDRPVFLSIGYSSCHWCHVMEHESFADADVAALLNAHFVSVKVDREERPDVDEVYMSAVHLMQIPGGWPLSVWLTPEGKPFMAGTYFPKESRWGRPGFTDLLRRITAAWADEGQRAKLREQGGRLADLVQEVYDTEEPAPVGAEALQAARATAELAYDREHGGFAGSPGRAPKFPGPSTLEMLLRYALRHDDAKARAMVEHTLEAMARGGIHDHVGGGFHRYSVTRDWLVPHFEKMLYDNAQLLGLYAWAYRVTGKEEHAATARGIARWVQREMTHPDGGFFSAQDADDPGGPEGEGGFYVWDPAGIRDVLVDEDAARFFLRYDVTERGNWPERPGRSILSVRDAGADPVPDLLARLYAAREGRPKPMTDEKILAGWNGLMISGFCRAYQALGDESLLASAVRAGAFVRDRLLVDGRLRRRWMEGEAAHDAVLSDHAYLVAAFLDLYETTFDADWLVRALQLNARTVALFHDEADGGFFFTAKDAETLIARGKSGFDQARPSGNGVMALNLLRLAEMTGDPAHRERARKTLAFFGNRIPQQPLGFSALLNALDFAQPGTRAVFVAGPRDDPATRALLDAFWRDPDPNRVLVLVEPGLERLLPPAAGKTPVDGVPAAYVCRDFACAAPVTDPAALRAR